MRNTERLDKQKEKPRRKVEPIIKQSTNRHCHHHRHHPITISHRQTTVYYCVYRLEGQFTLQTALHAPIDNCYNNINSTTQQQGQYFSQIVVFSLPSNKCWQRSGVGSDAVREKEQRKFTPFHQYPANHQLCIVGVHTHIHIYTQRRARPPSVRLIALYSLPVD